jgi:hypothetical protein
LSGLREDKSSTTCASPDQQLKTSMSLYEGDSVIERTMQEIVEDDEEIS